MMTNYKQIIMNTIINQSLSFGIENVVFVV